MKSFISVWKEEIVIKNGINLLITLILIFFKLEKSKSLYDDWEDLIEQKNYQDLQEYSAF